MGRCYCCGAYIESDLDTMLLDECDLCDACECELAQVRQQLAPSTPDYDEVPY